MKIKYSRNNLAHDFKQNIKLTKLSENKIDLLGFILFDFPTVGSATNPYTVDL